jgi:ribosome-associated protein
VGEEAREGAVNSEALAAAISRYAAAKKAREILELDLRGLVSYTDCLLICTGNTERQTHAIHDAIEEGVRGTYGLRPRRVEGLPEGAWILMDYLDVVVHIFTPAMRDFYRLEALWGEAPIRHTLEPTAEPASRL